MPLVIPRLYAIIDPGQTGGRSPQEVAEALLRSGVGLIQLRNKSASSRELFASAVPLVERVHAWKGVLLVNDRADVALLAGADGTHLGQEDLPVESARRVLGEGKWVGCSAHTIEQVQAADRTSADYLAIGPIFPTGTKQNPDPVVGLEGVRTARRATRKPLVGIGGITVHNARAVIEAGADSVAVISGLVAAPDIAQRAKEFLEVLAGC